MRTLLICLLLWGLSDLYAAKKPNPLEKCITLVAGKATIITSGRDADLAPRYQEIAERIFGEEGALTKLGVGHGDHILHFLPGSQIALLSSNNGPALGHAQDGAAIVNALLRGGFPLEYVAPGSNPLRSFYKDTVPFEEQVSIILHVVGHYFFKTHSRFSQMRQVDTTAERYELFHYMEELLTREDPDEVNRWYHHLLSLQWAQDVTRGSFTPPEALEPGAGQSGLGWRERAENPRHPKAPTTSILQAFVANLSPKLPTWKIEMARRFERVNRYISGAVVTKIINEGTASIFQEILPEHLGFDTLDHFLPVAELMSNVATPSVDNPYWLGREIFRCMRRNFNARPDIVGLDPLERDRRFLEFMRKEVIEKVDNFDAIIKFLDAQWVYKHKLAITRPLNYGEFQQIGPPPDDKHQYQWKIVSRDPKKVLEALARRVADMRFRSPTPALIDLNHNGSGEILLAFQDEVGSSTPLERSSMVATLFEYAQFMERPIVLRTVKANTWDATHRDQPWRIAPPWWPPPSWHNPLKITPIEVRVEPNGKVRVYDIEKKRIGNPILTKEFMERLERYRADLDLELTKENEKLRTHLSGVAERAATNRVEVASDGLGLYQHAPSAPTAIARYWSYLNRRLSYVLARAIEGRAPILRGPNGVRVRALPSVPQLTFDRKIQKLMLTETKPVRDFEYDYIKPYMPEDGYDLDGGIDGAEGDVYWGRNPQDDGDGDDDGDPGTSDEPIDDSGQNPGDTGNDPTWVDIDPDLYAEALGEAIELPRLRPKGGQSPLTDRLREGSAQRRNGVPHLRRIVNRAYARAQAQQRQEPDIVPPSKQKLLRDGLRSLPPEQWFVRDFYEEPQPDINAVVIFCMDGSGSMFGKPLKIAKKVAYDLRAILSRKYRNLEFRFITFDIAAQVHDNPEDFFRLQLLGGTDYIAGLNKVLEVEEAFPRAQWDRYVVGLGDLEDAPIEPIIEKLKEVYEQTEFTGFMHISSWGFNNPLALAMDHMSQGEEWFGFADLSPDLNYSPAALRKLFKNPTD